MREQNGKLTDALAAAERERERWAGARETVLALAGEETARSRGARTNPGGGRARQSPRSWAMGTSPAETCAAGRPGPVLGRVVPVR